MTHSGGKPHAVGDGGQRFEIRCRNMHGDGTESTVGWSSTLEGATAMADGVRLHPSWHSPRVLDRENGYVEAIKPEVCEHCLGDGFIEVNGVREQCGECADVESGVLRSEVKS